MILLREITVWYYLLSFNLVLVEISVIRIKVSEELRSVLLHRKIYNCWIFCLIFWPKLKFVLPLDNANSSGNQLLWQNHLPLPIEGDKKAITIARKELIQVQNLLNFTFYKNEKLIFLFNKCISTDISLAKFYQIKLFVNERIILK